MMADPASLMGDNEIALAPPLLLPAAPAPAGTLLLPPGGEAVVVAVAVAVVVAVAVAVLFKGAGAGVSTPGPRPRVVDVVELLLPDGAVAFSADGAGAYSRKGKRCSNGKISPIALHHSRYIGAQNNNMLHECDCKANVCAYLNLRLKDWSCSRIPDLHINARYDKPDCVIFHRLALHKAPCSDAADRQQAPGIQAHH
jgi:hypothetical protein